MDDSPLISYKNTIAGCVKSLLPGFRKKGYNFVKYGEHTTWLVHVQRSDRSTPDVLVFTINLGIVLNRLAKVLELDVKKCSVWEAQWRVRIGRIIDVKDDIWWEVRDEDTLKQNCENLEVLFPKYVLPWFEKWGTENAIRDGWANGKAAGLSNYEIKRYLEILSELKQPSE
jgi:hypothetical protein